MQHPVQNSPSCPLWVLLDSRNVPVRKDGGHFGVQELSGRRKGCSLTHVWWAELGSYARLSARPHTAALGLVPLGVSPFILVIMTDSPEHHNVSSPPPGGAFSLEEPPPGGAFSLDRNCSDLEQDGSLVQLLNQNLFVKKPHASIHVLSSVSWSGLATLVVTKHQ